MNRVLITGGRAPAALDLARAFAYAGAVVFVADSAPCFLARSSRAVRRAFRVPPPRQAPREFVEAIRQIVLDERVELIVPTCEEVFYLSRYADRLREITEVFCPDFALLSELHDKWRFTQLAQGLGIEVPTTWLLESGQDPTQLPVPAGDLVFKPVFSRFAVHTLIRPTAVEISKFKPTVERAWIAQRFIAGEERCSYSIARNGVLTAHAVYAPSWRAGRGSGYYFQPAPNPAIENFVRKFVAKINFTGQIAFDFIVSENDWVHVLECNPRATSGVHLFARADGLARAFDDVTIETIRPQKDRAGMLAPAMVLLGSVQALRRGRIRQFANDWAVARDVLWSARDPLPAGYLFVGLGATLLTAATRGITPQAASTRDIEWDGEELP